MKKLVALMAFVFFMSSFYVSLALADDSKALKAKEKEVWSEWCNKVPPERRLDINQFKALYDQVMAGKEEAYLIDTRTHPEFYAGHIAGTNHIHSGHMYTIPKKIKNKDAKIVVWCRTKKRQCYVGGFLAMYGYTNVWLYQEGIVGWIKKGYPLCNQFMGQFKVVEYHKYFTGKYKKGPNAGKEKDPYTIREFHAY
ncbi:MAG: rhodanese-like domain-containing protein [Desulfobacula sp.]|uniref:rhodanese-like domain-containing protein n=1 Tax=Desulfobacula sp. TaxID=2593537 RepID=UPI0025C3BD80|nr:rhodanese-like domain-containing protein [Desulfobacula sp.]MCD4718566.1 rhodanese-like domain-containing protein [Desulfobacula sp.]